jgi:hypothetical protein
MLRYLARSLVFGRSAGRRPSFRVDDRESKKRNAENDELSDRKIAVHGFLRSMKTTEPERFRPVMTRHLDDALLSPIKIMILAVAGRNKQTADA